MEKFNIIHERALERKGGKNGLAELMPETSSNKQLIETPDRDYLAAMTYDI